MATKPPTLSTKSMDFLDPIKRRHHKKRLIVGYILLGIAIGLGTVILVYGAYGYGINTKTGDIVENGLLFTGSKPGGANIYLNGEFEDKTTPARLVLPSGNYELLLKKDGYRDWQRRFVLEEHNVQRYVYPFLFPIEPKATAVKTYALAPGLVSQSPDRRWILLQQPGAGSAAAVFDELDTRAPTDSPRQLSLSGEILGAAPGKFSEVEWSSDNNFVLLKHTFAGGSEFILFDRRSPQNSLNLNRLFELNPRAVRLRDKNSNEVYIYQKATESLHIGDIEAGTLGPALIRNVLEFTPYGDDIIAYVTTSGAPRGKAVVRIWDNGRLHSLHTLPASDVYLLDVAQFQGNWYYVAGGDKSDQVTIFKNPIETILDSQSGQATAVATLRIAGANTVSFSTNTRFVAVQAGQRLAVYDFEDLTRYQYSLSQKLSRTLEWMDGHRLIGTSGGKVLVADYDAGNRHLLTPSTLPAGGYFSQDFNLMFTLAPVSGSRAAALQAVDMRAGTDLPD